MANGRLDQVIFWEWSPDYSRYDVQGYWLVEKLDQFPIKSGGDYRVFRDGTRGREVVVSRSFRETFTIRDPEVEHKKLMDEDCRNSLLRGTYSVLER